MIDLHCHSHFSDGTLSPLELIQRAQKNQLRYLSLTDHDTMDGYEQLHQAAAGTSITIIPGIEFSTRWKKYDIHVLGYQITTTESFQKLMQYQNQSRVQRAHTISTALQLMGIENAYERACELAGHERVGRPHFARLLIQEGRTKDMKSAFKQFLARGKSAYVDTPWISLEQAVQGIREAEGVAVLAHPLKYGLTRSKLHELILTFRMAGGEGMEVVSGEMTGTQIREIAGTCERFDLLASTGSDFHGDAMSRINLGHQLQLPLDSKPIWHNWNIEI